VIGADAAVELRLLRSSNCSCFATGASRNDHLAPIAEEAPMLSRPHGNEPECLQRKSSYRHGNDPPAKVSRMRLPSSGERNRMVSVSVWIGAWGGRRYSRSGSEPCAHCLKRRSLLPPSAGIVRPYLNVILQIPLEIVGGPPLRITWWAQMVQPPPLVSERLRASARCGCAERGPVEHDSGLAK